MVWPDRELDDRVSTALLLPVALVTRRSRLILPGSRRAVSCFHLLPCEKDRRARLSENQNTCVQCHVLIVCISAFRRATAPSGMSKFQQHGCACTRLPHACTIPLTIFSILPGGRPEPASCRRLCRCLAGIFFAPLRGTSEGEAPEGEAELLSEVASAVLLRILLVYLSFPLPVPVVGACTLDIVGCA